MSTRSPRNGTPSASSSRRWRSPFASEPSARTTRCHGTRRVVAAGEHRPGEARRPGREVAVGGHASPGGSSGRRRSTSSAPAPPSSEPEFLEQLQPDLAARGEGGHGVGQPLERHLADHGDRWRRAATRPPRSPVKVAPTTTRRSSSTTAGRSRARRRGRRSSRPAVPWVGTSTRARTLSPRLARRLERVAHGRHVRIGEDHARRARAVAGCTRVLAEDHVRRRSAPGTCPCA